MTRNKPGWNLPEASLKSPPSSCPSAVVSRSSTESDKSAVGKSRQRTVSANESSNVLTVQKTEASGDSGPVLKDGSEEVMRISLQSLSIAANSLPAHAAISVALTGRTTEHSAPGSFGAYEGDSIRVTQVSSKDNDAPPEVSPGKPLVPCKPWYIV